ncbi:uncharacterized protein LOC111251129 [Varroa destructor]|uniref:Uncharacterized protein n=1 Tax=Varroa destructor TaxID=109461 RepID=A0A7M7KB89_VARDE|nr:uncharacterized protein LOC111251129 [Varroa destructor]
MTRLCQYWPQNCTRKDMQLHSVPKFTIMNEFRFYGQPTIENLFKCRMMSRSEVCPAFDCVEFLNRAYFKTPARLCFVFDTSQLAMDHTFHRCPTPWLYELQIELHWNETTVQSFWGVGSIPVYVHQARTNPPIGIEAISMFQDILVEASVTQVPARKRGFLFCLIIML